MTESGKLKRLERFSKALDYKRRLNAWSLASHAGMLNSIQAEAAKMDKESVDVNFLQFLDVRTAFRASLQSKIAELTGIVEKSSRQSTVLDRRLVEIEGEINVEKSRSNEASNFDEIIENLGRNLQRNPSALRKQEQS